MKIEFVGDKARLASEKHFNGAFTPDEMTQLVRTIVKNRTHLGMSDRGNNGHNPALIIWGDYAGVTFQITVDSVHIKRGLMTVVAFYDVSGKSKEYKRQRFNMQPVQKG